MTNFEYYKDFFMNLFQENGFLGIGLKKGIPDTCHSTTCDKCDLHDMKGGCQNNIKKNGYRRSIKSQA